MSDPQAAARQLDRLLQDVAAMPGDARDRAEAVVRCLLDLYGAGLARIVELAGTDGGATRDRLAADELVASLLLLHGLHPTGLADRVAGAVARMQASLGGGLGLSVVSADEDRVLVRVTGRELGCGAAGFADAVERVVREAAPEVQRVEIETPPPPAQIIQILRPVPAGSGMPDLP